MKKMKGMIALWAVLSVAAGSTALLAQKVEKKEEKRSKAEQLDITLLMKAADTVVAGQAQPTGSTVT